MVPKKLKYLVTLLHDNFKTKLIEEKINIHNIDIVKLHAFNQI
jgi:hypothetical protein